MKINVLGCGSSVGVPVIGCRCKVCKSDSPFNKRTRSTILISKNKQNVLVDFGFDIKDQLINSDVSRLDAAILTHDHADHVSGIDNLRVFYFLQGKPLDVFVHQDIFDEIHYRYKYLFQGGLLKLHSVEFYNSYNIGGMEVSTFKQHHNNIDSMGIKVDNFTYSTDISDFPIESETYLEENDVWIVDCIDYKSNKSHSGLDKVLEWHKKYKPSRTFLTNMHHNIDYDEISLILPDSVKPAYDGMEIYI